MSRTAARRSLIWFATGVVVTLAATVIVSRTWRADAAPGDIDATFVPTSPCRLFDYRGAPDTVGPRSTPLGPGEVYTQPVTGSNGNCTGALAIPADAVAVAMNVTAVGPSARSNLRVFPADVATVPTVSNLNVVAGQPPVPNKVDVKLSPDGKIKLFNQNGTVAVFGDVVGYYTRASLVDLSTQISALEARIENLSTWQSFSVSAYSADGSGLEPAAASVLDLIVAAPVDGQVTINYSTYMNVTGTNAFATCAPFRSTEIPANVLVSADGTGILSAALSDGTGAEGSVSGTRSFDIGAGETITYSLVCDEGSGAGFVLGRSMTAIFTAAS